MELIRERWTEEDKIEFEKYLQSMKYPLKNIERAQCIINTSKEIYAIPNKLLRDIANKIFKGNYLQFLDLKIFSTYDSCIVNAYIINKITDFKVLKKYLDEYSLVIDCWALCDTLTFKTEYYEQPLFDLAISYTRNSHPFIRRLGINIFFNFLSNPNYTQTMLDIVDTFHNEQEYYVNMMLSWFLCESFIKQKSATLNYLKSNNHLNTFVINKMVQKCRDSYRVSTEEKEMLLKFKRK